MHYERTSTQSLHKGDLALQQGAHFRGEVAWACALPAPQQCTAGQHGALQHRTERAHGAVCTPRWLSQTTGLGSYSTAWCATAKHPRNAQCARKPGHYPYRSLPLVKGYPHPDLTDPG
jgi:hypothetical protein